MARGAIMSWGNFGAVALKGGPLFPLCQRVSFLLLWDSIRPIGRVHIFSGHCFAFRRVTFFASPKKVTKERRPRRGRPLRFATELPCDALVLRRLRNSQRPVQPVFTQTVLGDFPSGRCASRRPQRGPQRRTHRGDAMAFAPCMPSVLTCRCWGPLSVAEERSCGRGLSARTV